MKGKKKTKQRKITFSKIPPKMTRTGKNLICNERQRAEKKTKGTYLETTSMW